MTFRERLQMSKGSLLRINVSLYWNDRQERDNLPGGVYLILGLAPYSEAPHALTAFVPGDAQETGVLLLMDGNPTRVWVGENDVEIL